MLFITLFTSHFLFIHLFLEYFLETQNNRNAASSLQSFLLSIYFPLRCFLSVISAPTRSVRSGFREQVSLAWWPPSHKQAKAPELSSSSCWPHCLVQKKRVIIMPLLPDRACPLHKACTKLLLCIYNNLTSLHFQEP